MSFDKINAIDDSNDISQMNVVISLMEYYQKQLDIMENCDNPETLFIESDGLPEEPEILREKHKEHNNKNKFTNNIKNALSKLIEMIVNAFKKIISKIKSIGSKEKQTADLIKNNPEECKRIGEALMENSGKQDKITQEGGLISKYDGNLENYIGARRFEMIASDADKKEAFLKLKKIQDKAKAKEAAKLARKEIYGVLKEYVPFGILRNVGIGAAITLCATLFIMIYKRKTNYQLPTAGDVGQCCLRLNSQIQKSINSDKMGNVTVDPKTKDYMNRVSNWVKRYNKNMPDFENKHSAYEFTSEQQKIFVDAVYFAASATDQRFVDILKKAIESLKQLNGYIKKQNGGFKTNHLIDVSKQYSQFVIGINKAMNVGSDLIKNMGLSAETVKEYQYKKEREYKQSKAIL